MLVAIPNTFFHYMPSPTKYLHRLRRIATTSRLTSKKLPQKSPPEGFCRNVGEVRLGNGYRGSATKNARQLEYVQRPGEQRN